MRFLVLPIAAAAVVSAFAALAGGLMRVFKALAVALKHRREAKALAGLDRHMLADIGITRADVSDAFSEPFWEDPTALLRERALERRIYRTPMRVVETEENRQPEKSAVTFRRPPTDRPSRLAV